MAEELPFLAWQIIFDDLNYEALMNMRKTPMFRKLLFDYFSNDYNLRQLERNIILECIEDFSERVDRNIKLELLPFFVGYGYESLSSPEKNVEVRKLVESYLDAVIYIINQNKDELFSDDYIDSQTKKIKELKKENRIPYDLIARFRNANPYKFYELREISNMYKFQLDDLVDRLERDAVEEFSKRLFRSKNGYLYAMEYLEQVKKYISNNYSRDFMNEFNKCLDTRLNVIHRLFQ